MTAASFPHDLQVVGHNNIQFLIMACTKHSLGTAGLRDRVITINNSEFKITLTIGKLCTSEKATTSTITEFGMFFK